MVHYVCCSGSSCPCFVNLLHYKMALKSGYICLTSKVTGQLRLQTGAFETELSGKVSVSTFTHHPLLNITRFLRKLHQKRFASLPAPRHTHLWTYGIYRGTVVPSLYTSSARVSRNAIINVVSTPRHMDISQVQIQAWRVRPTVLV